MIGRLHGQLVFVQPPHLVLDVGGVGYELQVSMRCFDDLAKIGSNATLWTHLLVRDDAMTLYGFANLAERDMFRELIKVSGVGAKLALTLLSGMAPTELRRCVTLGEVQTLTRLPGVGKKTAERLIVELRDRLGLVDRHASILPTDASGEPVLATPAVSEARSALLALGYKANEAERMLNAIAAPDLDTQALIRRALQGAGR